VLRSDGDYINGVGRKCFFRGEECSPRPWITPCRPDVMLPHHSPALFSYLTVLIMASVYPQ
jgi:hypothetical protein